jgi:hypothetical protein
LTTLAEQTIAAAAPAIMWSGEDRRGVWFHIADLRPARLAPSRQPYDVMREYLSIYGRQKMRIGAVQSHYPNYSN